MSPLEILDVAEQPDVPSFIFGSEALADWTRKHVSPHTGECFKHSGFYVIIHPSLNPSQLPSFRVLSCWNVGDRVPRSWDVDDDLPYEEMRKAA